MGVSMVDMEGMEVGIRGRELGSRGVEAFGEGGDIAGLASLSIMITLHIQMPMPILVNWRIVIKS